MFVSVTRHQSNQGNGSHMTTTSKQVGIIIIKKNNPEVSLQHVF
jgi:hypothetical protein